MHRRRGFPAFDTPCSRSIDPLCHGEGDSPAYEASWRRVGLHIVLFEACSAFTRVAARKLAPSPNPLYAALELFCRENCRVRMTENEFQPVFSRPFVFGFEPKGGRKNVCGLTGRARRFGGAAPRHSRDEARDAGQREAQNMLAWARRRQVNLDHRLHLDDARGEFDEPQAQGVELRDAPYRAPRH